MKPIKKLWRGVGRLEEWLIVAGLAFMAVLNFANVLSRHIFKNSISFTEEIIIIVFVWVTMLGIAVGCRRKAHLGMSFVVEHLPKEVQCIVAVLITACVLVLVALLVYYGSALVHTQMLSGERTTALRWPRYVQTLSLPVGGVLIGLHTLEAGIDTFRTLWNQIEEEQA